MGKATRRAAGEGQVRRRPDGRWEARLVVSAPDGRRLRRSVFGRTQRDVVDALRRLRNASAEGRVTVNDQQTVAQFLEAWLRDTLPMTGVRPRTIEGYAGQIKRNVNPYIGRVKLKNLGPQHVQSMMKSLADRGLSPRSLQYARATLRRALRDAERWGLVSRNVATLIDPPSTPKAKTDDWPTAEEMRALIAGAADDRLGPLVTLVAALGLRKGEVLGLRWSAVDLEGRRIQIVTTLDRVAGVGLVVGMPKTDRSRRTLTLPAIAHEALVEQWTRQRHDERVAGTRWQATGYVFTTPTGEPLDPRNFSRHFHELCDRAGVPRRRFHALRHGAATLMLAEGVPLEVISRILGHGGIQITSDVYAHVQRHAHDQAAAAMDRALRRGQPDPTSDSKGSDKGSPDPGEEAAARPNRL